MKKLFVSFVALLFILSAITAPCLAVSQQEFDTVYLDDGSYFIVEQTVAQISRASDSLRAEKRANYYSASDELLWTYILTASFTYTPGISVTCTSASSDVEIISNSWSCTSKSATPNGASATGSAEMIQKFLLVTIKTVPVSLTITCDTYGNLS